MVAAVLLVLAATVAASGVGDRRAGASKITLAQAIAIALRAAPGEALSAEILLEDGEAVIEVTVYTRGGRLLAVAIDGESGRVLEIEEEDAQLPRGPSA
jgi:uncharacterized membrane protein YkoI